MTSTRLFEFFKNARNILLTMKNKIRHPSFNEEKKTRHLNIIRKYGKYNNSMLIDRLNICYTHKFIHSFILGMKENELLSNNR